MLKIRLNIEPPTSTQQQKGFNRFTGRVYEKPSAKQARKVLVSELRPFAPSEPFKEALLVNITWYIGIKDKKKQGKPKITRPDLDNLAKMILDVMTSLGYWIDDSQIVELQLKKFWVAKENAGIEIEVGELGELDNGEKER